ncbi:MAG TPA: 3'-5' exonuclease [Candidatus Peribacteraceae bacterium]|nr:3'-5' exonuclease [Candidatus Peribacteraceae bacterium]
MLPALTVFDLETTGLDPRKGHRIVEIAGVRIEGGRVIETSTFSSFVNPERDIPLEAQRINNIRNEDVSDAPTIMTVLPQFLAFAQGSILLAHNAAFDKGFLEAEKEFCWGFIELPEILCTMRLSQSLFPTAFRHNLDVLSERFNMPLPQGRHRALPDVLQTANILIKMLDHGKIQSMDELRRKASLAQAVGAFR